MAPKRLGRLDDLVKKLHFALHFAEVLKLLASALAFWAAYYLDVSYVRDYCARSRGLLAAWYGLLNLLFVVVPLRHSELEALGACSLRGLAVQLLLAAFFMARLRKMEKAVGSLIIQVAWNAATVWKWFFTCAFDYIVGPAFEYHFSISL